MLAGAPRASLKFWTEVPVCPTCGGSVRDTSFPQWKNVTFWAGTEAICEECERLRATCKRLRIKSHAIQQESFNVEKSTREVAIRAAARKVQDTNALAVSIENELVATVDKVRAARLARFFAFQLH